MILACNRISKTFVGQEVLKQVSFHIEEKQKAALVGINGAGKSTLLKIIVGELQADEGEVTIARDATMGYLAQHQDLKDNHTILESTLSAKSEVLEFEQRMRKLEHLMQDGDEAVMEEYVRVSHEYEKAGGYAYHSEVVGVLKGLGFAEDDFGKVISTLSGGEKTRVALGKLLLSKPDILLLDEPTNHLDMSSITWLEGYLTSYPGAVLIVCHDRYFLDRVVTKVMELDLGRCTSFEGNYSAYGQKKQEMLDAAMKAYLKQQADIKHQEAVIEKLKSFNREKSIKRAESREKMLDKIEVLEKPQTADDAMRFELAPPVISGNDVLGVTGLSKSFGDRTLFRNVDFAIRRGEHIALIGNNGTGKTTILKMINELIEPDAGSIRIGAKVQIAYYDQEHQVLHMEKTLFEEMSDEHPDMSNTQIRNVLAAFLFTGEEVYKKIGDLSGGERGRVSLAKLMLANANFLILDEPTNHLDIMSKEILEQALNRYTGTVLYVSHDRYFINQTAGRILELSVDGVKEYLGNYDYYLEKKVLAEAGSPAASETAQTEVKKDWQARKNEQAALRKSQNDLKKLEDRIAKLEEESASIDEELTKEEVFTDVEKLMELNTRREKVNAELEELYEKWEEMA
ncbi:MAG: ABC-F family ATP-binding cassette domain-containing protein [Lachnospiraceae bacterium]|nr:ABC-F family ATP-binding cassette domain-containing protein [Lachnospiraceae bacterium]